MKKGFTVVELLAAIVIMALVIIISIPAYNGISNTIKKNSYDNKISMMIKSTNAYINKYKKDEVFEETKCFTISYLIGKNVFSPDNDSNNGITNPFDNKDLDGYLVAKYDSNKFEVIVTYDPERTECTYHNTYS